jgi:hypothetical protein
MTQKPRRTLDGGDSRIVHTSVMQHIRVGDRVKVHGEYMTVIVVHPAGTIDVQSKDGRCYRVTGLW